MNDDALTLKSCAMQCYMLTTTEWMMNDEMMNDDESIDC